MRVQQNQKIETQVPNILITKILQRISYNLRENYNWLPDTKLNEPYVVLYLYDFCLHGDLYLPTVTTNYIDLYYIDCFIVIPGFKYILVLSFHLSFNILKKQVGYVNTNGGIYKKTGKVKVAFVGSLSRALIYERRSFFTYQQREYHIAEVGYHHGKDLLSSV